MPARIALLPTLAILTLACLSFAQDKPTTPAKAATPEQIERLVKQLSDFHFDVRQQASDRLAAVGLAALPAVEEASKSRDPEVCMRARRLIDGWAAQGMVPALLFKLSDDSPPVRACAADALGKLGAAARPAIPALTDATHDRTELVRCCARDALKTIESTPELKLEVVDLDGPLTEGGAGRYRIKIANTGTAPATTVRILIQLPNALEVTRVEGPNFRRNEQRIISIPQTLDPNAALEWEVHTKAAQKGTAEVAVELMADQLTKPMREAKTTPIHAAAQKEID
jgi:uncharacterized repeat protein (TIGR01451 family)